jgi:hypothetical protein
MAAHFQLPWLVLDTWSSLWFFVVVVVKKSGLFILDLLNQNL